MNEILQEAIAATRAGKKKEAQLLLATNLKENPDDAQSWYLLGMLVDSKEKQAAYLGKALALNPDHPKAQAQMAKLTAVPSATVTTTTAVPISDDPFDYLAQAEGSTLPNWLAQDAPALQLDKVGARVNPEEMAQETAVTSPSSGQELPDWLQSDASPAWVVQEQPTQVSPFAEPAAAKPSPKPKPKPTPKPKPQSAAPQKKGQKRLRTKQEKKSQLNLALGALMVIMILVILTLAYIAF